MQSSENRRKEYHLFWLHLRPGARVVLRMLIINVWNKFPNKKFQKAPEIGKRV